MPDYIAYQESVANEFRAYEMRVRDLIDSRHWPEEGRYKEIILSNFLKRVLPRNVSVGTGFIRCGQEITSQIDIIVYDNSFPTLFSEGDFIITTPHNVLAIIEVKSCIRPNQVQNIIKKANANGEKISGENRCRIFNGVFAYNYSGSVDTITEAIKGSISEIPLTVRFQEHMPKSMFSCVNHVVFGVDYFARLRPFLELPSGALGAKFCFYVLERKLAIAYFISNLVELIVRTNSGNHINELPEELSAFLYPLPDGKEKRLIDELVMPYK